MTLPELYRQVFNGPGGHDVLADLAAQVKSMPPDKAGSAGHLLAHITRHLHVADRPAPKGKPDRMKASGGRIAHG